MHYEQRNWPERQTYFLAQKYSVLDVHPFVKQTKISFYSNEYVCEFHVLKKNIFQSYIASKSPNFSACLMQKIILEACHCILLITENKIVLLKNLQLFYS